MVTWLDFIVFCLFLCGEIQLLCMLQWHATFELELRTGSSTATTASWTINRQDVHSYLFSHFECLVFAWENRHFPQLYFGAKISHAADDERAWGNMSPRNELRQARQNTKWERARESEKEKSQLCHCHFNFRLNFALHFASSQFSCDFFFAKNKKEKLKQEENKFAQLLDENKKRQCKYSNIYKNTAEQNKTK